MPRKLQLYKVKLNNNTPEFSDKRLIPRCFLLIYTEICENYLSYFHSLGTPFAEREAWNLLPVLGRIMALLIDAASPPARNGLSNITKVSLNQSARLAWRSVNCHVYELLCRQITL